MIVNFVGNFQNGYVGEVSDCVHLAREMEALDHVVRRIPQDEWREHVIHGDPYPHVPADIKADINIITKWHHFDTGVFAHTLKTRSGAPVFYWVWDYMWDEGIPEWHRLMCKASDLYLTNEVGVRDLYRSENVMNMYYFPFDVCDGNIPIFRSTEKKYDVVFTGSCISQGHRMDWLPQIHRETPVTIFSWNWQEWEKMDIPAHPAVYGDQYNRVISESKVVLGMSVNPDCYGYWSNRVGKVLRAGGCLLYEYAPGMELYLGDAVSYFSSPEEAIEKIRYFLSHEDERMKAEQNALNAGERFTSSYRVKQLMILIDRYLKTGGRRWDY